ncbi:hypothetical protein CEE45_16725 [Candidatus Heimdallarchaeota archaeon B3_Heim]|nr:MAG: hypothetical protein CEE45_16725 [Candidatus Heimdallarchaeota archaeon B3_Heim]
MAIPLFNLILAVIIGLATGLVLQKGRICANTAFRNLLLIKNSELASALFVTVLVELIGYQILELLPGTNFVSNPIPFSFVLLPSGAFIFGIGTVIAGGCAGGTCYRIGEGSMKSLLAFIGFGIGVGVLVIDPFKNIVDGLRASTDWSINDQIPSLEIFFPRWVWTAIAIILMIIFVFFQKEKTSKLTHLRPQWTPLISGVFLGFLGISARITSTPTGRAFGFSTTDGIGELFQALAGILNLVDLDTIGWAGFFIIGLIGGSFISSLETKEFKVKVPAAWEIVKFSGGGFILGFGAMLALGCNFSHILGGIPELGISSLVATLLMILGNWIASFILYKRLNQPIPSSTPILL